jgi:hypothetical protein
VQPRSSINGAVHIVVPGRFVLFQAPTDNLPAGQHWVDERRTRGFSASFCADLLRDLGVSQVCAA